MALSLGRPAFGATRNDSLSSSSFINEFGIHRLHQINQTTSLKEENNLKNKTETEDYSRYDET